MAKHLTKYLPKVQIFGSTLSSCHGEWRDGVTLSAVPPGALMGYPHSLRHCAGSRDSRWYAGRLSSFAGWMCAAAPCTNDRGLHVPRGYTIMTTPNGALRNFRGSPDRKMG